MFAALNAMMLDMLAAVARKDYEDRRRRQAQGIVKAKAAGAYRGRPEDTDRNAGIAGMLRSGMSWTAIQAAAGCSRATIAKVAKRAALGTRGAIGGARSDKRRGRRGHPEGQPSNMTIGSIKGRPAFIGCAANGHMRSGDDQE